ATLSGRPADGNADRRRRTHGLDPEARRAAQHQDRAQGRVLRLQRQVHRRRHAIPLSRPRWRCGRQCARACAAGVRCIGLLGLGQGRRDARSRRAQLAAGSEHRAGHDFALAGAESRGRGRHRLSGTVLARAGNLVRSRIGGRRMKGATGLRFAAWLIAITLVALPVVGVLQGWFASERWPVRALQVHATFSHVSATQVRTAVTPSLGAGFFAIDLDKVRDAVAALPWVSRVEVSKHWPDALDITITEIDPVAHWGSDALLGRDGRIFKVPNAGIVNGLPQFNAPDDRVAEVLEFYRTAQIDFAPYSL